MWPEVRGAARLRDRLTASGPGPPCEASIQLGTQRGQVTGDVIHATGDGTRYRLGHVEEQYEPLGAAELGFAP